MCWLTTLIAKGTGLLALWFAYRMYLWCVDLQQRHFYNATYSSCDLLTECIFDVLTYNYSGNCRIKSVVVICLQNVSLMCWLTTILKLRPDWDQLWFAYRMYLWCVDLQPCTSNLPTWSCCDLLTECIFDVLTYNISLQQQVRFIVVICLQNVSLMCWLTTCIKFFSSLLQLWFAYRMYLWCVDLQQLKWQL